MRATRARLRRQRRQRGGFCTAADPSPAPACLPRRRRDHVRLEVQNTGRMLANLFLENLFQRDGPPDASDAGGPSSGPGGGGQ